MAARERNYRAEYERRKARGAAAGKPVAQSTGHTKPVRAARTMTNPDDAERLVNRLTGRANVHVYVSGTIGGVSDTWQLFPHGGIRADTLQGLIDDAGGLVELVQSMLRPGRTAPVAAGSQPSGGPAAGGSGRFVVWKGPVPKDPGVTITRVVVQWAR